MNRSGYSDECKGWELIRWRGAVKKAISGKRGQAFLRELRDALDAMPEKALITEELAEGGEVCTLGSVGQARGMDMSAIDPEARTDVANAFGIPLSLACEIMNENDEGAWRETPQERWMRMRKWVASQIAGPL